MPSGASSRASVLRDAVQTRLWPVPTVGVVLAVALGVLLPELDGSVDDDLPGRLTAFLFGGGSDAARTVLSAIAGSLITVTSLTFSLTVVTLQLASSQFSPRLLRTFSRDRFVHLTLALFLGTFAYSLVVLRTVRTSADSRAEFVPQVSVTVAVVLTLVSVFALVLFLDHLATQIRVETMLDDVHTDASETLARVLQKRADDPPSNQDPPQAPTERLSRSRPASPGSWSASTRTTCWPRPARPARSCRSRASPADRWCAAPRWAAAGPLGPDPLTQEQQSELAERVAAAAVAGRERTAAQDIAYGLRQLTDVATKALSPGINDPTTAVHALGHISGLLCEMVDYQLGPKLLRDDHDRVRVVLERPGLADLLDSALAQPRRYAATAPSVLARITVGAAGGRLARARRGRAAGRPRPAAPAAGDGRRRRPRRAEKAELARLDTLVEQALLGRGGARPAAPAAGDDRRLRPRRRREGRARPAGRARRAGAARPLVTQADAPTGRARTLAGLGRAPPGLVAVRLLLALSVPPGPVRRSGAPLRPGRRCWRVRRR